MERTTGTILLLLLLAAFTSGCGTRRRGVYQTPPGPQSQKTVTAPQRLFVYPAKGQTDERTARDRYECHLWAVKETDFDPSLAQPDQPAPVAVVYPEHPEPGLTGPIVGAAGGAAAGAAIGAVAGDPGKGAAIGAASGAIAGAVKEIVDAEHEERARREDAAAQAVALASEQADADRLRSNYTRAISACLEARGYSFR